MNNFLGITEVWVPKALTDETQRFLRTVGQAGREGMALWVGTPDGHAFEITDLLIPRQQGVKTKDGVCVIVDGDEMHRINVELFKSGLRLVAQVHSHPTDAYHSETDDDFAIATTAGSLSLVVPDFAARNFALSDCAVYRLDGNGTWQRLPPAGVSSLIRIRGG